MAPASLPELWALIHDLQGKYQLEQELRILREAALRWAPEGVRSILDIGCGDGRRTLHLSGLFPGARVTGVEIREALAEEARAVCSGAPVEIKSDDFCVPGPLHRGQFDLVHVRFALHLLGPGGGRETFLHHMALACHTGSIVFIEDHDSGLQLLYPPCPFLDRMRQSAARLRESSGLDVEIGRKLPVLLAAHGFGDLHVELSCLDNLRMGPDFVRLMAAQAEVLRAMAADDLTGEEIQRGLTELSLWASQGGALSMSAACVVTGRREAVIQ